MSFFQLARYNAWRKPLRAVLLMFCIAIAFLIYGLTASFLNGSQGTSGASDNILGVVNQAGRGQPLPLAYRSRITASNDVAAVAWMARMRGFVGTEKNIVMTSAVDPQLLANVNGKELGLTPELLSTLEGARDRVLVGKALAQAQDWRQGQRITVTAFNTIKQDGNREWSFEIAGIFDGESASTDTYFMIARYDYLNSARMRDKDTVDAFIVRPRSTASPGILAADIDAIFANSSAPTRTQSEKQFLEAFIRQFADIALIVNLVLGAAFVTILMIVINTMFFALRERVFEIGVLKTIGFSRLHIMALILLETMFICVTGGMAGIGLAWLATVFADPVLGLAFSPQILIRAGAIILVICFITGILPAVSAMRMPVANAFGAR